MFEIINSDKKQIIISLHLEQIYTEMKLKTHIKQQIKLFDNETMTKSCIDYLVKLNFEKEKKDGYECIIDFKYIKFLAQNTKENFMKWLIRFPKVKVSHCEQFEHYDEIKNNKIEEDNICDYRIAFNEYGKRYIVENCRDTNGYTTQIGIQLGVYIDLKRIINDSIEMLRWSYIIANDLKDYFLSISEEPEKKISFFCHTMNGTYIAGILSQLLGYNLVYVDHLGPYNKLNKVDFYKGKTRSEEFIIIADMVCLGNEFLRAKNIVEYLGGTVRGGAGILKMNISSLLDQYSVNVFALYFTPEEAEKDLGYTIRTKLCGQQCSHNNEKEI